MPWKTPQTWAACPYPGCNKPPLVEQLLGACGDHLDWFVGQVANLNQHIRRNLDELN